MFAKIVLVNFREYWDLTTIPDERLRAEWGRRNSLRRKVQKGGRMPKNLACPFCSDFFTSVALRAHRAGCRQQKLQDLVTERRHVFVVPTFDDLNGAGFEPLLLTRETLRLEKIGYHDAAEIPTRAIVNIIIPEVEKTCAQIAVSGRLVFHKPAKRWVFTEGVFDFSGNPLLAPWAVGR